MAKAPKEPAKSDKASKPGSQEAADSAEAGAPPKKKSRLLLIVTLLVLLAGGGGTAWFFFKPSPSGEPAPEHKVKAPPVFVTLEPFTVNLLGDNSEHYLQMGIDLKLASEGMQAEVKLHMPEIRNSVLLLLSGKRVEELKSVEGKNKLRQEIRTQVNKHLGIAIPAPESQPAPASDAGAPPAEDAAPAESNDQGVTDVLLTSFVIQ